ncbi:MAG TPA: TfoX/Sxy family protein [Flavipsychrobacter sp.]|jgi:TfoX/Sxy family transcriptional regulator of competence genes|nr:TfoX/Sxy family protein [Flavipsychrobacter sp.]
MPYNETLANRVRKYIAQTHDDIEEKRMFSGLCFMVNDKMLVALNEERMMVRLDPKKCEEVLAGSEAAPMVMGTRTMKGYIRIGVEALNTQKKLGYWLDLALDYNRFAKSSKKKKH